MLTISAIIAVLNGRATIGRMIGALQAQSMRDFEIIVIDDGSTDGTYDYVSALAADDPRIRVFRLPDNKGPAAARNEGLKQAQGEWVCVLDADDWIEPGRFHAMLQAAMETGADIICDNMKIYDHALGRVISQTRFGKKNRYVALTPEMAFRLDSPFRRHSIGYTNPFIRRSFLQQYQLAYDPSHRVGEDFLLLAEILLCGARAIIIPDAYYVYVHMVSPTTGKKAPNSKTKNGADSIVRASDELLWKYGQTMSGEEIKALLARREKFRTLQDGRAMVGAVYAKRFAAATSLLMQRPQILLLILVSVSKLVYANLQLLCDLPRRLIASVKFVPAESSSFLQSGAETL